MVIRLGSQDAGEIVKINVLLRITKGETAMWGLIATAVAAYLLARKKSTVISTPGQPYQRPVQPQPISAPAYRVNMDFPIPQPYSLPVQKEVDTLPHEPSVIYGGSIVATQPQAQSDAGSVSPMVSRPGLNLSRMEEAPHPRPSRSVFQSAQPDVGKDFTNIVEMASPLHDPIGDTGFYGIHSMYGVGQDLSVSAGTLYTYIIDPGAIGVNGAPSLVIGDEQQGDIPDILSCWVVDQNNIVVAQVGMMSGNAQYNTRFAKGFVWQPGYRMLVQFRYPVDVPQVMVYWTTR